MRSRALIASMVLLVAIAGFIGIRGVTVEQYVEDFTTTTYRDAGNTTALWDTISGELKLPPFDVNSVATIAPAIITTSVISALEVEGRRLYVGNGDDGLSVFDIQVGSPGYLTEIGVHAGSSKPIRDIEIQGNFCYVACNQDGLWIFDITDPTNPGVATSQLEASAIANHENYGVTVDGNRAYLAIREAGVKTIDISDPYAASTIYTYTHGGIDAIGIEVAGDNLCVTDIFNNTFFVLDASDPSNLVQLGSVLTRHEPRYIDVEGDFAYTADRDSGLTAIDISDPVNPMVVSGLTVPGFTYRLAADGDYLYTASRLGGVSIVDITDPLNMRLLETLPTTQEAFAVDVDGIDAYIGMGDSVQIVRVAEHSLHLAGIGAAGVVGSKAVQVSGNHAFVAGNGGLDVVDITDPNTPVAVGSYGSVAAGDVYVSGDYAYVAAGSNDLHVVDISNPATPTMVGSVALLGNALKVHVSGNYAYVATDNNLNNSLVSVDISDPTSPFQADAEFVVTYPLDVYVSGDYAYCPYYVGGLMVIDVSDPTAMTTNAGNLGGQWGVAIQVSGNYAYVVHDVDGLRVIDVTDPTMPTLAGTLALGSSASNVFVVGDRAYVTSDYGLEIIDVSDPTMPTFVTNSEMANAKGVYVTGDHAYVARNTTFFVREVYQRRYDLGSNVARSLEVDNTDDPIFGVRLTPTPDAAFGYLLSADGGANWQSVQWNDDWVELSSPGNDLRWRTTLSYYGGGANPSLSALKLEWLAPASVIYSINDIGNDQGKQVRLTWARSGHDFAASPTPVTSYAIFRKIESGLSAASDDRDGKRGDASLHHLAEKDDSPMLSPPGWDFIMTVPAFGDWEYSTVVPTLKDSTIAEGQHYTTFMVRAATETPQVYFDSPPDSGYSVDNLSPAPPMNFVAMYNTGNGNQLVWDPSTDADFDYYSIYRDTDPNFAPSPANRVYVTSSEGWADPDYDGGMVYYKVTVTDFSGNESDASGPEPATAIEPFTPARYALHQNVPNPFNPMTSITYDLPEASELITLRIYDVAGALVRSLVNSEKAAGRYTVTWDGQDEAGERVASGVYFYRLTAGEFSQTRKLTILK